MFRVLELFHLRHVECLALKQSCKIMNISLKCFVTFHSKVSTKCHMLLETAILVLFGDNSIMKIPRKKL